MSKKRPEKATLPEPITPEQVLAQATKEIEKSLPSSMAVTTEPQEAAKNWAAKMDALLKIELLNIEKAKFGINIRKTLNIRDLTMTIEELTELKNQTKEMEPMIVSPFISKSVQARLREKEISYADATGNFLLASPAKGMFLSAQGASTDPWRKRGRPRESLKGKAPAKIVRALIDTKPPMSVPELIKRAKSSSGVAYRVLEMLDNEDLVVRREKLIEEVNWPKLLERWSNDYSFLGSNSVIGFLDPRGLDAFLEKLKKISPTEYAITGSLAAQRLAPYAEPRQAMLYAKFPIALAEKLGVRPVDTGANVLIAATEFDVVFERTSNDGGLNYVAPSQAVVDLLNGPGRNPVEGRELLDWMVDNEDEWRR